MKCNDCKKYISKYSKTGFCRICLNKYRAKEKFKIWLETDDLGISVGTTLRGHLRDELLNYYGKKCSICNIKNEWNEKELKLILDHIDGDASNNKKDNLRFVCPNCDSQLDTYKSKNKMSARNHRKKYY